MKNLKIKLGLFSLLAILAASVFLVSCEQDSVVPVNKGHDIKNIEASDFENSPENFDIDTYLDKNAHFSKTIGITNSAEKKSGALELGIRVKSNDKNLLDRFDEDAVVFKYNEVDNNSATEEHTDSDKKSTVKAPKRNKDTKVVQIEILGIEHDDSYKKNEYTGYVLEFSDDIKSYLSKNNISLSIDFIGNKEASETNLKKYTRYLFVDKANIYATGGTTAYYYYANCHPGRPGGCSYSTPMYYHSYKYFYPSPWGAWYPVFDMVSVCCLWNCYGKSLGRMDFYNGYPSSIYVSVNYCLSESVGCGSSCFYN